ALQASDTALDKTEPEIVGQRIDCKGTSVVVVSETSPRNPFDNPIGRYAQQTDGRVVGDPEIPFAALGHREDPSPGRIAKGDEPPVIHITEPRPGYPDAATFVFEERAATLNKTVAVGGSIRRLGGSSAKVGNVTENGDPSLLPMIQTFERAHPETAVEGS